MNRVFLNKIRYLVASTMMLATPESFAQQTLEEIIVTATRRAEGIQDVPVSVSAITVDQIEDLGLIDMADLSLYVPNFEINDSSIVNNLYVRGLGGGLSSSVEQSVGRFVDGVYIGRAAVNKHGFMDLAGVEILRGPQGALFGKNTVAGAMIVRTADPTDIFESGITLSAGDYSTTGGHQEVQGYVSGPLSDQLAARVAVRYRDSDGYYFNRLDGPDGVERTDKDVRLKLRWTPTDELTAHLKLEKQKYDFLGSDSQEMPSGPAARIQAFSPEFTPELDYFIDMNCSDTFATVGGDTINTGSFCPGRESETDNAMLKLEYEVGAGTFTSISAYQTYENDARFSAIDGGSAGAFKATRSEEYSGFSQELRFTSAADEAFDYILGLYYEDSDIDRDQISDFNLTQLFAGTPSAGLYLRRHEPWEQKTKSYSGYGQLRWSFTEQLTLILGGRYTSEDKDFEFERFFSDYGSDDNPRRVGGGPGGPAVVVSDGRSENKFTGSVTLQWHANENVMLYASFAQGHKTGGFSDRIESATADFEFDEESNDNFEIGAKTTWLDGALLFNATIFHMSIEGLQVASAVIDEDGFGVFSVDNAADSTSQGLEADLVWHVNEILTVGSNFAYTDATYDSFPGSETCPEGVTPDEDGTCDLAGFNLNFAPKTKGTVYANLYLSDAVGEWDLKLHGDIAFTDETHTDIDYSSENLSPSRTLYNASVALISPSEKYSVSLLGKNLSDEKYCAWCLVGGPAAMGKPREISVKFSAKFD